MNVICWLNERVVVQTTIMMILAFRSIMEAPYGGYIKSIWLSNS